MILQEFKKIFNNEVFFKDTKFVICVSMAMLNLMKELVNIDQLYVVTVNHKLRPEAFEEAEFVAKYCNNLGINHITLEWQDDMPLAKNQEEARDGRYKLIFEHADKIEAPYIFTAHHLDDIIENFFIRVGRGSGLKGMNVYKPASITSKFKLIRPLINSTKKQILNYLEENQIEYRNDQSNFSDKYLRSRLRKSLENMAQDLPSIKTTLKNISAAYDSAEENYINKIIHIVEFKGAAQIKVNKCIFQTLTLDEKRRLISEIITNLNTDKPDIRLKTLDSVISKISLNKTVTAGNLIFKNSKMDIMISKEIRKKNKKPS